VTSGEVTIGTFVDAGGIRLVELHPGEVGDRPLGDEERALHAAFNEVLAAGEGYPQAGPISRDEFVAYWLTGKSVVMTAWTGSGDSNELVGAYYLQPNGFGRAAHVANGGYFVSAPWRNRGLGGTLLDHSMTVARSRGFDALQFNFVFVDNPARRLYQRKGFREVGRVPEVIDGADVLILWRSLADLSPPV